MQAPPVLGFLIAQAATIGLLALLPEDSWWTVGARVLAGWASALAVVLGMRRHRPAGATAYYLFGVGVFMNVGGNLVEKLQNTQLDPAAFGPTLADACWLAVYPALIAGMALLVRRRARSANRSALIDTAIITVGLGLLSWVFLIRPQ